MPSRRAASLLFPPTESRTAWTYSQSARARERDRIPFAGPGPLSPTETSTRQWHSASNACWCCASWGGPLPAPGRLVGLCIRRLSAGRDLGCALLATRHVWTSRMMATKSCLRHGSRFLEEQLQRAACHAETTRGLALVSACRVENRVYVLPIASARERCRLTPAAWSTARIGRVAPEPLLDEAISPAWIARWRSMSSPEPLIVACVVVDAAAATGAQARARFPLQGTRR